MWTQVYITKDDAERGLICITVDLGVIRMCKRLFEDFQIFLVFFDVMSTVCENLLILSLRFVAGLRKARRSGEALDTMQGT